MKYQLLIIFLLGLLLGTADAGANAADISGTWACSIDTGNGLRPNGTLVFKQAGEKLTGTLSGQSGEQKITGTVKGDQVVFSFDITMRGQTQPSKVTYTGTIESPTKMTGAAEYPKGTVNWSATKK